MLMFPEHSTLYQVFVKTVVCMTSDVCVGLHRLCAATVVRIFCRWLNLQQPVSTCRDSWAHQARAFAAHQSYGTPGSFELPPGMHDDIMGMLGGYTDQGLALDLNDPMVQQHLLRLQQQAGYGQPDMQSGSQTVSARTSAIEKSLAAGSSTSSMGSSSVRSQTIGASGSGSGTGSDSWQ